MASRRPLVPAVPSRAAAGVLACAALLGACHAGDLTRNATQNAFGASGGRIGAVAGAVVESAVELNQQMSVQFSPEQEYYVGRGVAANAIATSGLDPDEARQAYVRKIGAALVALAPRVRSTYGGYHFAVLNGAQPNGLSGPGGFVMVTRGALDLARSEDEVAGILAHEIAHVSLKHGEAVIRRGNQFQSGLTSIARVGGAAGGMNARDASKMTQLFGETVSGLARDLASKGYGSDLEAKADREGTYILYAAGYDAGSISKYLAALPDRPRTTWSAHPESADRIRDLAPVVAAYGGTFDGGAGFAVRETRFRTTLASVAPAAAPPIGR